MLNMPKQLSFLRKDIRRFFPGNVKPSLRQCVRVLTEQRLYALALYRIGRWICFEAKGGILLWPLKLIYLLLNKVFVEIALGIYLPADCDIGPGLYINSFQGLVINPNVTIGQNCSIGHGVIIGTAGDGTMEAPYIGDNVFIGSRAVVIGSISVGDGVKIGANAVVNHDVPPHVTVAGVPARIVRRHKPLGR